MNIRACAEHLLTYFSPEEREIPESETYPGRHDAVARALNEALQDLFGRGGAWVRKDERGHILYAPTTVGIVVTQGSKLATIATADWQDRFAGCSIVIQGSNTDNQIRNASASVVLKFPHDGETSAIATQTITVSGVLTSDGSTPVVFPPLIRYSAALYSDTGTDTPDHYYAQLLETGQWSIVSNIAPAPQWTSVDVADSPDLCESWTAQSPATGTPTLTVANTYTPTTATVYQDSIVIDEDVLEVLRPVRVDRRPLVPYAQPYDMTDGVSTEDFGAHTRVDNQSFEVANVAATAGVPAAFSVETWSPDEETPARLRMRIYPAPDATGFLEYRCMLLPPRVNDILSSANLPVPFGWLETVFLPVAVKKLRSCPFWRGIVADDEVNASYQSAVAALTDAAPKQTGGIRFIPLA